MHSFRLGGGMPRYVILHHVTPAAAPRPPHWDLLLETAATLRTWALAEPPEADRGIAADLLADHRAAYLDHEGPVAGGRGTVTRWDAGTFDWTVQQADRVVIAVAGQRLRGWVRLALTPTGSWELAYSTQPLS
jgi:hypothetical protein